MSIDSLINKLATQEKDFLSKKIFSPYVAGGSVIQVRLNGVVYKFKTAKKKRDGFGVFKATDANNARLVRQAEQHEIAEYLNLLPRLDVILIYKLNRWLAYPANKQSFEARFKTPAKPFNILMGDGVEPLDTASVRFDGQHFWFDSARFTDTAEQRMKMRERLEAGNYVLPADQSLLSPEELSAFKIAVECYKTANMSDLERRLTGELGRYDATMEKFVERGDKVEVRWKDNLTGTKLTSVFRTNDLSVITAGICLSGGDKTFDLQSLVGVARRGRNEGITYVGAGGMSVREYEEMYGGDYYDDYDDYY